MSEEAPSIQPQSAGSKGSSRVLGVSLLGALIAFAAYAFHEHRASNQLAAQNSALAAQLASTRGQIDDLESKLKSIAQAQSPAKPAAAHSVSGTNHIVHHAQKIDPRWKQLQGQINEQGKQIESTRQDLSSTRTELQGSIARTHDELVLLQKKGERAYFEFDVDKSGQFRRSGPVGVRLRKANTKHEYADLELMVDDFKVSKKHVNIFEPVVFYTSESQLPVELVINTISKNHIHGYVSEPKYKASDLQAMAGDSVNSGPAANGHSNPSPERPRLEVPMSDSDQN